MAFFTDSYRSDLLDYDFCGDDGLEDLPKQDIVRFNGTADMASDLLLGALCMGLSWAENRQAELDVLFNNMCETHLGIKHKTIINEWLKLDATDVPF